MNETLRRIVDLVPDGDVRVSAHGYDEMARNGILAGEAVDGAGAAVLVTAYRPDPARWTGDFLRRKQ